MTSPTDVSPPADETGIATHQSKNSRPRPGRLNQALAWVGIVAGGLFIVAAVFFSGFFLSWSLSGPAARPSRAGADGLLCGHETGRADETRRNDGARRPDETGRDDARRDDARRDDGAGSALTHNHSLEHPSAIAPRVVTKQPVPRFGRQHNDDVVRRTWLGLVQHGRKFSGDGAVVGRRLHCHRPCSLLGQQTTKRSAVSGARRFHPGRRCGSRAPCPGRNRQRRILPPIDVAVRETLSANLIHHGPT